MFSLSVLFTLALSICAILAAPLTSREPSDISIARRDVVPAATPADVVAYLEAHNDARAQHGAAPLAWSDELASAAQAWANTCVFDHSGGAVGPFGENLAAGTGDFTIPKAIGIWVDEASQYNPLNPMPSSFTQVVWKSTTEVGCAVSLCDGIFPSSFGKALYYVCEYNAPGNVIGEFSENVQA